MKEIITKLFGFFKRVVCFYAPIKKHRKKRRNERIYQQQLKYIQKHPVISRGVPNWLESERDCVNAGQILFYKEDKDEMAKMTK